MFVADAQFVSCPSEGAYLDAAAESWVNKERAGVFTLERALQLAVSVEWPHGKRHIHVHSTAVCACCGKHEHQVRLTLVDGGQPRQWRCDRHIGRNPCLIDGCGRTHEAVRPALGLWICGRHWKLLPRHVRDVELRLRRLARRSGGWTNTLIDRYWRIWPRIRDRAIRASRGETNLDLAAIEREFGV